MTTTLNKIWTKFFIFIFAATLLTSCDEILGTGTGDEDEIEENAAELFKTEQSDLGIYSLGKEVYTYTASKNQESVYTDAQGKNYAYRLQNDGLTEWLKVEIEAGLPTTIDATVTTVISGKGIVSVSEEAKSYEMTVVKVGTEKIWLWEDSSSTGVVVNRQ